MKPSVLFFICSICLSLQSVLSEEIFRPVGPAPLKKVLNPFVWPKQTQSNKNPLKQTLRYLGKNVYHDLEKNIYFNKVTGDYYDPKTGAIYRKKKVDFDSIIRKQRAKQVRKEMPNFKFPKTTRELIKDLTYEDLKKLRKKLLRVSRKKKVIQKPKSLIQKCSYCKRNISDGNEKVSMAITFLNLMNNYRRMHGLQTIFMNYRLNDVTMIQSKYMKFMMKLNHDNFEDNLRGYKIGFETVAFLNAKYIGDNDAPGQFLKLLDSNPTHKANMLKKDIKKCGFGAYYEVEGDRYWGTLICTD